MNRWHKAQCLFSAVAVVGVVALGVVIFLGDRAPLQVSVWGGVTLAGLVGNAVCALLRVAKHKKGK